LHDYSNFRPLQSLTAMVFNVPGLHIQPIYRVFQDGCIENAGRTGPWVHVSNPNINLNPNPKVRVLGPNPSMQVKQDVIPNSFRTSKRESTVRSAIRILVVSLHIDAGWTEIGFISLHGENLSCISLALYIARTPRRLLSHFRRVSTDV
jgi:hypothetical protein